MTFVLEDLSTQPTPTPDIEQEGRLVLRESQQLERSVRHFGLDGLDSGAEVGGETRETQDAAISLRSNMSGTGAQMRRMYFWVYLVASVSP
jgi:hypothetical protein